LIKQVPAAVASSPFPLPILPPEAASHNRARAQRDHGKTTANVTDADISIVK
jgi:hypothetical protein